MRIPTSHHYDDGGNEDRAMTPMIDVVFLLLIFFVCAATGKVQEAVLTSDLSGGSTESELATPEPQDFGEVRVYVQRQAGQTVAQVNTGGETYTDRNRLKQTLRLLASATTEVPMILDVRPDVPAGDVIDIFDTCLGAGFESISFAAGPGTAPARE